MKNPRLPAPNCARSWTAPCATKADLAALETRITAAMASQTRWLAGLVLAAAAAAAGVVIAVDRLAV
ncbi:MAG: hypothetical protein OXR64_07350 [Chloroflexota bacterium]|nr:hypothetical protein [Chloroflexota bacterium]MDE2919647.1 hypothetical protein [Chloroflexota bacterium]